MEKRRGSGFSPTRRQVLILRRLDNLPAESRGCVLSIGKFDGLHRGHAEILARLTSTARRRGVPAVVFTFDPPPARLLRPESSAPLLCDVEQKIALFERFDLNAVVFYPTSREFLARSASDFFRETVVGRFGAIGLVEGKNFCFGRGKEGNDAVLKRFCDDAGLTFEVVPSFEIGGVPVSSSEIRRRILSGDVEGAATLLGRPYRLRGIVEVGDRRGRTLGFPTANLGRVATVFPAPGLYAAAATTPDGRTFPAAVNLGGNPTFGVDAIKIETHLLGFDGDLYGRELTVDFLRREREIVRFPSVDALLAQMRRDLESIRAVFSRYLNGNLFAFD